ncbi:hypothetical protein LINGRAHAP2_LOCUS12013 [Linum grandiflorum]
MDNLLGSHFDAPKIKSVRVRPKADNILSKNGRVLHLTS